MATLNKLFKNEFESAETEKEPRNLARFAIRHSFKIDSVILNFSNCIFFEMNTVYEMNDSLHDRSSNYIISQLRYVPSA